MPVAATTRTVLFVRPRPRPWTVAWTRFVAFLVLVSEVMREAQALEREEHRKRPFISW
jgi:hypothetical protein